MRVLLAVLLVGIAGCGGGGDNSPDDVAVPSSPVKAENAAAGESKSKAAGIEDLQPWRNAEVASARLRDAGA